MSRDRRRPGSQAYITVAVAIGVLTIGGLGWSHAQASYFEATSIVVPVELRVNPVRVPRIVSALNRGPHPPRDDGIKLLIPPAPDSRLTLVIASGDDSSGVAAAANERALALVDRLNGIGRDLGVFPVSSPATSPLDPEDPPAVLFGVMSLVALVCLTAATGGLNVPARTPPQSEDAT